MRSLPWPSNRSEIEIGFLASPCLAHFLIMPQVVHRSCSARRPPSSEAMPPPLQRQLSCALPRLETSQPGMTGGTLRELLAHLPVTSQHIISALRSSRPHHLYYKPRKEWSKGTRQRAKINDGVELGWRARIEGARTSSHATTGGLHEEAYAPAASSQEVVRKGARHAGQLQRSAACHFFLFSSIIF